MSDLQDSSIRVLNGAMRDWRLYFTCGVVSTKITSLLRTHAALVMARFPSLWKRSSVYREPAMIAFW